MIDAAVIVPTTGSRPALLRRALASVRAQCLLPAEILVVVDGPADRAAAVTAQIEGLAAEVVAADGPRGAGAARNHGARVARARYLCFLDDDDVWKPGYLAAVFAEGLSFDLALTAFEKHNRDDVRPEKVPPVMMDEQAFLVANPGLRGSNLVITRELFWSVGGFSEQLPSFNDMDFGLRLAATRGWRYRRIVDPLVEYHAHDGERLSRRGARAIPPGLEGFLQEHGTRMDHLQEAAFRARAIELWGVDPWAQDALERRLARAAADGTVGAHFPGLLHAAETTLLEATCRGDAEVDARQELVDRLCEAFERRSRAPRLRALRLVVITTDTPGSVAGLLSSLQGALDRSRWRCGAEGPLVELLVIRNDHDPEVDEEHEATLRTWSDRRISIAEEPVPERSRPVWLAEARAFAFRAARARGWEPSPEVPLWFLDEDFRFEMLAPSLQRGFRRIAGGSLLHRLESLALRHGPSGIDALIGGNSGAAPVPAIGTLRRQLLDLLSGQRTPHEEIVFELLRRRDHYYDLSTDRREEPYAPLGIAWWRPSGEWTWEEVVERMILGLPVTRPALPSLGENPPSAWGSLEPATVTGGNTVLLAPRVLCPEAFAQAHWGSVRSRRGDTTWCIRCRSAGANIVRASLPLLHDRAPRRGASPRSTAVRDALADALGVGLYETLADRQALETTAIEQRANQRLAEVLQNLAAAIDLLEPAASRLPPISREKLRVFMQETLEALSTVRFASVRLWQPRA